MVKGWKATPAVPFEWSTRSTHTHSMILLSPEKALKLELLHTSSENQFLQAFLSGIGFISFPSFQFIPSLLESPLLVSTSSCEIEDKVGDRECC